MRRHLSGDSDGAAFPYIAQAGCARTPIQGSGGRVVPISAGPAD